MRDVKRGFSAYKDTTRACRHQREATMKCERDHKDGGVCLAPVRKGECTRPEQHR